MSQIRNRISRARTGAFRRNRMESLERRLLFAAGDPFNSFGTSGLATTDFFNLADAGHDMVVRPNGRIIVVGEVNNAGNGLDFGIAQYTTGGTLDTSFGNGGRVSTHMGSTQETA